METRRVRALPIAVFVLVVAACGDDADEEGAAASQVNRPPVISGSPATSVIENDMYDFTPKATDPDGDPLVFNVSGKPGWMSFDSQTGNLSGRPRGKDVGKHRGIVISVSDGQDDSLLAPIDVDVLPASSVNNQPPVISGAPASSVTAGQFYDFIPQASDPDGDPISFQIENMPGWASFDPVIGRMSGTPATGDIGIDADIVIRVSDGIDTAALGPFVISVNAPPAQNTPPIISGTPASTVIEGSSYSFQPQATDSDNDPLTFSVFNAPPWASFDTSTGLLGGTPQNGDAGTYGGITIAVSDGQASDSLPAFSIDVIANNLAPTISGSPAGSVMTDAAYSFTPTASDPDGDPLSFTIANLPSWASFDPTDGSLTGTPTSGDVGSYSNISITVSDGQANDTLGPFSIQVQASANGSASLSWNPPTQYTDGSALIVDHYVVYWGTSSGIYTDSASVSGGLTSFVVDKLLSGTTYYFSITALDAQDIESVLSNEASKSIP